MSDLRKELMDMKYRLGFVERVNCSEEMKNIENQLKKVNLCPMGCTPVSM